VECLCFCGRVSVYLEVLPPFAGEGMMTDEWQPIAIVPKEAKENGVLLKGRSWIPDVATEAV
jgi:hypothetical protein